MYILILIVACYFTIKAIKYIFPLAYLQVLIYCAAKIINTSLYIQYLINRKYDPDARYEPWQGPGEFS